MSSDDESTHTVEDKYVDIPDENGQVRPWKVLSRPNTLGNNFNIRKVMELDSEDSEPGETNRDARERRKANAAKKMLYRSICQNIRHALNASQPNALNGHTRWSQIPSHTRALVHETALGEEPYLMRFPGGWISEEIMKQQLRNKRDTKTRAGKQASAQKISKPMQFLVQKTPAESRARTATVNSTLRTTTANTPRVRPADNQDSDEDDERWGDQIDAELKGLGRKAQQSQGTQSAGTSAVLSTRQAAATSSRANPPAKSTIRPRMRPPPASDSDSKSESEFESEPEATPPSAKGKEPAKGSKKAKGTNNARLISTNSTRASKRAKAQ